MDAGAATTGDQVAGLVVGGVATHMIPTLLGQFGLVTALVRCRHISVLLGHQLIRRKSSAIFSGLDARRLHTGWNLEGVRHWDTAVSSTRWTSTVIVTATHGESDGQDQGDQKGEKILVELLHDITYPLELQLEFVLRWRPCVF